MSRQTRCALLPLTLPLLLLACGQNQPTPVEDLGPYANGANHPWSYTRPPGTVTPLTLDPGRNNLYYEPILSATNGWGPVEVNRSNGEQARGDGRTLTVQGRTWDVGYGVHAGSELRFSLKSSVANVNCTRLDGFVGVDDEVGDRGSVTFQIWLDGSKVWDSGVMTGRDAAKYYSVDLQGRTDLRLVVTNGGDNFYYDHADWLQPTVHCEQGTGTPGSGRTDPTFHKISADFQVIDSELQRDGKIILFGIEPENPGVEGYVIARYNPDGSPDTTFGQNGRFVQQTGTSNQAIDLTVAPDGRIVALGRSGFPRPPLPGNTAQDLYVLLRLLPNGSPDPTLKLPDGRSGAALLPSAPAVSRAIAVQPDGKTLVVGGTESNRQNTGPSSVVSVVRLLEGGQPDPSFGTGGQVLVSVGEASENETTNSHATGTVVRVLPDGRILVGAVQDLVGVGFDRRARAFIQLTSSGAPDSTFGTAGKVLDEPSRTNARLRDIEVLANGQFVLGDTAELGYCQYELRNANGTVATSRFLIAEGVNGANYQLYAPSGGSRVTAAVQSDGKVLISGCSAYNLGNTTDPLHTKPVVVRVNPDGTIDRSFGTSGIVFLEDNQSVHVQENNGIVVGLQSVIRLLP